jgi:hypothetical protein
MPKVKDLGINVIPATMRPPEIGGGGGGTPEGCWCTMGCTRSISSQLGAAAACGCTNITNPCIACTAAVTFCTDCTVQATSICGGTGGATGAIGCGCTNLSACTDCTVQATSICGGTACACTNLSACTDCTVQSTSICGGSGCGCTKLSVCTDCTVQATSICGGTGTIGCGCSKFSVCTDCTAQATSICGTSPIGCGGCTNPVTFFAQACAIGTIGVGPLTTTTPVQIQGGGLTMEHVRQLRSQLQQQMQALDEHAKTIGPKTSEEIDKREADLKQELAELAARRKDLSK